MHYSPESTLPLPVHSNGHAGHRRSFAHNTSSSQGPFASLGNLPRAKITPPTPPKFHIADNDSDTDSDTPRVPEMKLKVHDYASLTPPSSVLFPTKSPERSTTCSPTPLSPEPAFIRSPVPRTNSSPVVFLSNGKPLKSSLKSRSTSSSSTSLSTSSSSSSLNPGSAHIRAASAPSTPRVNDVPPPIHYDEEGGRTTPTTPKNVHFAPPDSLRDVRLFSRSAKPAAVSSPTLETETDTEGTGTESERFSNGASGGMSWASTKGRRWPSDNSTFPFPKIPVPPEAMDITRQNKTYEGYILSPTQTSPIPNPYRDPSVFIHTEGIKLLCTPPSETLSSSEAPLSSSPHLSGLSTSGITKVSLEGSILVRNISYQKTVCVRFTLDNWQTTSEVAAYHVRTLASLPPLPSTMVRQYAQSAPGSVEGVRQDWDRFEFKIPLSDYPRLHERTLWMVARFSGNGGEWWDNNRGSNYKICFERVQIPYSTSEQSSPTANSTGVENSVVDPGAARLSDFERHMAEAKGRHTLAPLTMPLRLPALPRRRRTFHLNGKDSDDDSDDLPTRSMKTKPVAPTIDTNVARASPVGRDRSGSGTFAQSAEGSKVMQGALDRLNLRNYARPRSMTSSSVPPFTPLNSNEPATSNSTIQPPSSITSPPDPPKESSASNVEARDEAKDKDSATSTPETSPLVTTPPLSGNEPHVDQDGKWFWAERPSSLTLPSNTGDLNGDRALRAFLQQWCFATTPDYQAGVEVA